MTDTLLLDLIEYLDASPSHWHATLASAERLRAAGFDELQLDQAFQKISGTVSVGGRGAKIEDAVLTGEHIRFAATLETGGKPVRHEFSGKIFNNAISGEMRRGASGTVAEKWEATRTELREARMTDLKPGVMAR